MSKKTFADQCLERAERAEESEFYNDEVVELARRLKLACELIREIIKRQPTDSKGYHDYFVEDWIKLADELEAPLGGEK
jgi:hypothetical protein